MIWTIQNTDSACVWFNALCSTEVKRQLTGIRHIAVPQQDVPGLRVLQQRGFEILDCPCPGRYQLELAAFRARGAKKLLKELVKTGSQCSVALEIDSNLTHHRVPPISPFLHSSLMYMSPTRGLARACSVV